MAWNWQHPDWPSFTWDKKRLDATEQRFLLSGGVFMGVIKHLEADECGQLIIETMTTEALDTSEIEGELLDRASVQSSIQRQFGLATDKRRIRPKENGIAKMMVSLYQMYEEPLTEQMLFGWHKAVMGGVDNKESIGCYRTGNESMQIISGSVSAPKVHFEAPPSSQLKKEMDHFIDWFNRTGKAGKDFLPAVTRAGIAHLYFESIHPFEDGNGRIGRAIAEKALAQSFEKPTLIVLATTILANHKHYYKALEAASKSLKINDWLTWFAEVTIEAQQYTLSLAEFLLNKTRLLDRLQINKRQEKVLLRMFKEGPNGFKGGLSAGKYIKITGTSPATATRDLVDLVHKGALHKIGEHKHARYHLNITTRAVTL